MEHGNIKTYTNKINAWKKNCDENKKKKKEDVIRHQTGWDG